jgi:hypothetical protein
VLVRRRWTKTAVGDWAFAHEVPVADSLAAGAEAMAAPPEARAGEEPAMASQAAVGSGCVPLAEAGSEAVEVGGCCPLVKPLHS